MSTVIDITGLPPERIVFSPSPLAELGCALHALAQPGHHPGLHGWTSSTTAALKQDLADRLHEADFLWSPTFSDISMAFAALPYTEGRPGATLAEDLDLLDRVDDEQYVSAALEISCSPQYNAGGPSPLVDAVAREQALERATARGPRQTDFVHRLLADPPGVRAWIRRLFEDCDQAFFADVWQRVRVQLAADTRHKAEVLRRKGLREALAEVSPALSLEGAYPGDPAGADPAGRGAAGAGGSVRIVADKLSSGWTTAVDPAVGPGLTFVPSALGWPHLMVLLAPGWRPVIHYPLAASELAGPPSLELLRLRMEALAHPVRMRICRSVGRAAFTTGELAVVCGISAPEVSRHLAALKKAGLITTRRRGRYVLHQLDLTVVARLGSDFLEGVLR
ncbi:ArsR family transcriptional regulator [Streptomyces albus subsp. albus]|nr:ArsR family transcriptional regulator [Streptomyces albus subsp. albus]